MKADDRLAVREIDMCALPCSISKESRYHEYLNFYIFLQQVSEMN